MRKTPAPAIPRSIARPLLGSVVVLTLVLSTFAASADDTRNVVVTRVPGRGGDAVTNALFDDLARRDGFVVQDQDWFQARVDARGLVFDEVLADPVTLVSATEARDEEAIDAVLRPGKGKGRGTLILDVIDGATGSVVGTVEIKVRGGKLNAKGAQVVIDEAVALMANVGWPEPAPLPPPELAPFEDPTSDAPPLVAVADDERPKEGPLVVIEGGVSALRRDFDVVSSTVGFDYSATLYPGFHVAADLYPYPWGGAVVGNLGLTGHFLQGSETVSLQKADGSTQPLESVHTEWSAGAIFRQEFSPTFLLRYGVGYEAVDFVLADNPVYSTTTYTALWLSAHAVYGIVDGLAFEGGLRALPWVGLGASESELGTGSTAFGAVVDLSLTYDLFAGVFVRGGYHLRAITTTFEGTGTRQIGEQTLTNAQSNDFVNDGSLSLGYRY